MKILLINDETELHDADRAAAAKSGQNPCGTCSYIPRGSCENNCYYWQIWFRAKWAQIRKAARVE